MNRPRPVLTKAGIAGAVTSVAGVLTFLGYDKAAAHLSAETTTIVSVAIGVVTLGSHLLAGLSAQKDVTPKHAPQADDGMPLVRADQVVAMPLYHVVNDQAATTGATPTSLTMTPTAIEAPDADAVLAEADAIHPST